VTALETLANALRFAGLLVTIAGLWFSAGGMRVVVSGRIDERRKSASSLKFGLPLLLAGIVVLVLGTLLAKWAQ
jgi:O-antigen/teichoic acid export membrane protein